MNAQDSTTIVPSAPTGCWETVQPFQLIEGVTINQSFSGENMIFFLDGVDFCPE